MANPPQNPKSGTLPPPNQSRAQGEAPLAGGAPVAGATKVIVSGEAVAPPLQSQPDAPLSKEQLQDLSDASKTTGNAPAKPGTIATTPPTGDQTHLQVRARSPKADGSFRRAGMTFGREWQALSREEIGEERAKAIEAEPMLEVKRVNASEAERLQLHGDPYANAPESEVREELRRAHARIDELTKENDTLREQSGGDRAPRDKSSRGGW